MTQQTMGGSGASGGYEGEDFICRTCGCEVMVKHWGDPPAHAQTGVFMCHCGSMMEPEHGSGGRPVGQTSGRGDDSFRQDDFLSEGSGAGGATGMGRTSSSNSSPGGGL